MKKILLSTIFMSLLYTYSLGFVGNQNTDIPNISISGYGINANAMIVSNIGVTDATAAKILWAIDMYGDVAMVASICLAVVGGAGLMTAGIIATAKKLGAKYGKKYAQAW